MSADTILVVIDPTHIKQHALEQAAVLAEKLDKKLELFISTHDDSLKHYREILGEEVLETSRTLTLDKLSGALQGMAEPYRFKKLEVAYDVSWDWPLYEGIIRKALQTKPFMIVKDTHYHSKLSRAMLRNTDWSLIKNCPFPILFDKQIEKKQSPLIISSINPINEAEEQIDKDILKLGQTLASALDGVHKVFHCYKPVTAGFVGLGDGRYGSSLQEQNQEIEKMHKNRIESLAVEMGMDSTNIIFEQGDAKTLLPQIVDDLKADLVLMGSQTKSGIKQAFVGSTAEAVLDEIGCNVLVLKPDSFTTSVSAEAPPEYPQVVWPI